MIPHRDDLLHAVLSLVVDGSSPLATLYPEVRLELGELPVHTVIVAIQELEETGLVRLEEEDRSGARRPVKSDTYAVVEAEYGTGARHADVLEQLLDRTDIWIEITPEGRRHYEMTRRA